MNYILRMPEENILKRGVLQICTVYQILLVRYGGLGINIHGRDEKCMQNLTQKT